MSFLPSNDHINDSGDDGRLETTLLNKDKCSACWKYTCLEQADCLACGIGACSFQVNDSYEHRHTQHCASLGSEQHTWAPNSWRFIMMLTYEKCWIMLLFLFIVPWNNLQKAPKEL